MSLSLLRTPLVITAALILGTATSSLPAVAHSNDEDPKQVLLDRPAEQLPRAETKQLGPQECENGFAGPFPCRNINLESFVPVTSLGGVTGNDVWGWTDPQTGREYALAGTSNGTAFVDVTVPENPVVVGQLPTQSRAGLPLWRDIKVHGNHAFIVSEYEAHGMQVFDLTRLRGASRGTVFTPDAVYRERGLGNAHNVAINPDSGFAYAVGSNTCQGGLHMINIKEPTKPTFAGCYQEDGYTHDVQCVNYHGPDAQYFGREVCFASNEDTVTIVDVTDKARPKQLSRTGYPTASYTHQGWLTPDHRWFLFGDELDEQENKVENTTTYIMGAGNLQQPKGPVAYQHQTPAIDHNLYVDDDHVYESNYTAGLRMLKHDEQSLAEGKLTEEGFFDVYPAHDLPEFLGTWSNYPYFKSGTVVVNTIDSGLFVLRPTPQP